MIRPLLDVQAFVQIPRALIPDVSGDIILAICVFSEDLDFSFMELNPFTLVDGEPYPLDMRGELDDTAAFKNFNKYVLHFSFPC